MTMTQLNVRVDEQTRQALDALTADGTSVAEAVRVAVKRAHWEQLKAQAYEQARAIAADPEQQRISAQVMRDMDAAFGTSPVAR